RRQRQRGERPGPAAGVQERAGEVLGVGAAAPVAERQQLPARGERVRHGPRACLEALPVARGDLLAQLHDLLGLGLGGAAHLLQHGLDVGTAGVEEGVQGLDASWLVHRYLLSLPVRVHHVVASASPACTSTVSPTRASTSATLTSSRPRPVSTSASAWSRSSTTTTGTAWSEQVMQTSSWQSLIARPPARAPRAARR